VVFFIRFVDRKIKENIINLLGLGEKKNIKIKFEKKAFLLILEYFISI